MEARRSLQVSHSRGYPRKLRSGRFGDQDCIMISYSPHIVLTIFTGILQEFIAWEGHITRLVMPSRQLTSMKVRRRPQLTLMVSYVFLIHHRPSS